DRRKNYADRKRKPMEFEIRDRVMLKVSPRKGVVRFVMPLEGVHIDDTLHFMEEPVEIMEREIKRLKRIRIPLVKVRWNSRRGPEFTWERMFKLNIEPISARLKNNRDAHETCPNSPKPSEKLVVVTLINKDKRVRFIKPVTSLNNSPKQTDSLKTKVSNKPLLTSIGVKPTTSDSGSKPSGNIKNNRISRPPRSNQKNKVEHHPRTVKSSLNKMNSISEPISNALVKHSVRNDKFESVCAICNKCLFDANHDMCLVDFVNDVI
nr:hypothetical protein [Tanacetum cinerariifolium]